MLCVVVVVEWLYYSKRIIIDKRADLSEFFSLIFVGKNVGLCFMSNEKCHFFRKNGDPAKRVVNFRLERDTFRNKIMEIVEDFDEKSYTNNGCESKFLHFSLFSLIFPFFIFLFLLSFFSQEKSFFFLVFLSNMF